MLIPPPSQPGLLQHEHVAHGEPLPADLACRIPVLDSTVLRLLLMLLESEGLHHVPLYIVGGYIRDLLLGGVPHDLDLAICLQGCPEHVALPWLLDKLPGFVAEHESVGIVRVRIGQIFPNKANVFVEFIDAVGGKVEVDIVPTTGGADGSAEVYQGGRRTLVPNLRGTLEQDISRRDLTITALYLRVSREVNEKNNIDNLSYQLIDLCGGLGDLKHGILRPVHPPGQDLAMLARHEPTEGHGDLSAALGIDQLSQEDKLQSLWWGKVFIGDPVRILRAVRMAIKLHYPLSDTFWRAAPFGLHDLRLVPGDRKLGELEKIAGYGFQACAHFFELAFARGINLKAAPPLHLASSFFGGRDRAGAIYTLCDLRGFDVQRFHSLLRELDVTPPLPATALLGCLLGAAVFAAELDTDAGPVVEFGRACDGLCVPEMMRLSGQLALEMSEFMVAVAPRPRHMDRHLAMACGFHCEEFCRHLQTWNAILLPSATSKLPFELQKTIQKLALSMVRCVSSREQEVELQHSLDVLMPHSALLPISSFSSTALSVVPKDWQAHVAARIEVLLRMLGRIEPLQDAGCYVQQLLDDFPALGDALGLSTQKILVTLHRRQDAEGGTDLVFMEKNPRKAEIAVILYERGMVVRDIRDALLERLQLPDFMLSIFLPGGALLGPQRDELPLDGLLECPGTERAVARLYAT